MAAAQALAIGLAVLVGHEHVLQAAEEAAARLTGAAEPCAVLVMDRGIAGIDAGTGKLRLGTFGIGSACEKGSECLHGRSPSKAIPALNKGEAGGPSYAAGAKAPTRLCSGVVDRSSLPESEFHSHSRANRAAKPSSQGSRFGPERAGAGALSVVRAAPSGG